MNNKNKFRIVPLAELADKDSTYAGMSTGLKGFYKKLRRGSVVKLLVEAVGLPKRCPEQVWVIIDRVGIQNGSEGSFHGTVNTKTSRSDYHGVVYNMPITFHRGDIIDLMTKGAARAA